MNCHTLAFYLAHTARELLRAPRRPWLWPCLARRFRRRRRP